MLTLRSASRSSPVRARHELCGILLRSTLLLVLAACATGATPPVPLSARVADTTVAAGGTAQLQIFLSTPTAIVDGQLSLDLDPAVFGAILSADVFSATGDQVGSANIQAQHLDVVFHSLTGGIGRLPNLPVLVVNAPVLLNAASATITFKSSGIWTDTQGVQYSIAAAPGTLTVKGSLSVGAVTPGGGSLPQGATVRIDGTGFAAGTTVQADGVSIASTQFITPQQINVTLGAATDLTGKRVTIRNPDGATVTYFPALRGSFVHRPATGSLATVQPIFPQQLYAAASAGLLEFSTAGVALQNPDQSPVDVTIQAVLVSPAGSIITPTTITLPPGASYLEAGQVFIGFRPTSIVILPAVPIRMAIVDAGSVALVNPIQVPTTEVQVALDGGSQRFDGQDPLIWHWALGTAPPPPKVLDVLWATNQTLSFTVSPTTQSGTPWLTASPTQGTTCNSDLYVIIPCPDASKVTVTVDPSHLSAGTYNGTLTFTSNGMNPVPHVVSVVLYVDAHPLIFTDTPNLQLSVLGTDPIGPLTVHVTSEADPLPFSVAATTQSEQNWLFVTPPQGSTPATFKVSATPAALNGTKDTGSIIVTGPFNTLTIPVPLDVGTVSPPQGVVVFPTSLQFSVQAGQPAPPPEQAALGPPTHTYRAAVQTSDGGTWLSATLSGAGLIAVTASVDPTGLAVGTYHGVITLTADGLPGTAQLAVTLSVWNAPPPPVTITPPSLSFTANSGSANVSQTINVTSGVLPLNFVITTATTDGTPWLGVAFPAGPFMFAPRLTPDSPTIVATPLRLAPGIYHGTVTITAPPGSTNTATISVTLTVNPTPPPLPQQGAIPLVTSILNAASQAPGSLSPGEIITLFGQNIGPSAPAYFTLGPDGKALTNLGGVQVLFDGVPAPLIYASAAQINAIVPYEIAGKSASNVVVNFGGVNIAAGGFPITDAAPAIFSLTSTGQGAGAVLNQDNSINTAANPAARSSIVQIYATGQGLTSPPGVTGEITALPPRQPVLPVHVSIGGVDAQVIYADSAPQEISGLFQVNAAVPLNAPSGSNVPVILKVGDAQSQDNLTIAIK